MLTRSQSNTRKLTLDILEDRCVPATAGLQLINNSGMANAEKIDVYVNNVRVANDVAYQQATPFLNVRAGKGVKIDVTDGNARNNAQPLFT